MFILLVYRDVTTYYFSTFTCDAYMPTYHLSTNIGCTLHICTSYYFSVYLQIVMTSVRTRRRYIMFLIFPKRCVNWNHPLNYVLFISSKHFCKNQNDVEQTLHCITNFSRLIVSQEVNHVYKWSSSLVWHFHIFYAENNTILFYSQDFCIIFDFMVFTSNLIVVPENTLLDIYVTVYYKWYKFQYKVVI